jgi:hypothetical protein
LFILVETKIYLIGMVKNMATRKERTTQVKDEVIGGFGWVMVFTATFNNISVISWRSVLLVEEIGVPGENHRPAASH